ncbi:CgeB family protein [Pedobacter sp.]|uniref:CgeB family protein n=1 Tax=Pedobacter sp. TaxID=1411316 RepID=UPI003D7FB076
MNILYIGDNHPGSTATHRANALLRLGHEVTIKDPQEPCRSALQSRWANILHFRTGYRLLQSLMIKWVMQVLDTIEKPDLIWVDSGELLGFNCVKMLKSLGCPVVIYNVDDPTGKRDGARFRSLLKAITLYDLVVVVRKESERECLALGAKRVLRVFRSYDEVAHRPYPPGIEIPKEYQSEVVFIGTWMRGEKRDRFLLDLINKGVPLSIWGNSWERSRLFSKLKKNYKGKSLQGKEYIAAIQGAKLCLGLLSKGNRDLHTTRSLEIPYAGGLLCAQRTSEHLELFREGTEAVFWSDATECATVCKSLLSNVDRERVRLKGMERVRNLRLGNEDVCREIIDTITQPK